MRETGGVRENWGSDWKLGDGRCTRRQKSRSSSQVRARGEWTEDRQDTGHRRTEDTGGQRRGERREERGERMGQKKSEGRERRERRKSRGMMERGERRMEGTGRTEERGDRG
eukprot:2253690-Rhodomonas_salina.2